MDNIHRSTPLRRFLSTPQALEHLHVGMSTVAYHYVRQNRINARLDRILEKLDGLPQQVAANGNGTPAQALQEHCMLLVTSLLHPHADTTPAGIGCQFK